jgi:hypothetical protein
LLFSIALGIVDVICSPAFLRIRVVLRLVGCKIDLGVSQSIIPALKELNSCPVFNTQKEITLNDLSQEILSELSFAANFSLLKFSNGMIFKDRTDMEAVKAKRAGRSKI